MKPIKAKRIILILSYNKNETIKKLKNIKAMKTTILTAILFFATTAIFAQVSYQDKNDTPPTTTVSSDSAKVERKVDNLNKEIQKTEIKTGGTTTTTKTTTPAERKKKARPGSGMYSVENEK